MSSRKIYELGRLFWVLGLLISLSISCSKKKKSEDEPAATACVDYTQFCPDSATPAVKHLGVDVAPYNSSSGYAGSVFVSANAPKPFVEFGTSIGSSGTDSHKIFNHFTYIIKLDATIYSIIDAILGEVKHQDEANDYEIYLYGIDKTNCCRMRWYNMIDHVKNVSISSGQVVSAGDPIGSGGAEFLPGAGMIEIGLNFGTDGGYCPSAHFDPLLKTSLEGKLTTLMSDIETAKARDWYSPSAMPHVGCVTDGPAGLY